MKFCHFPFFLYVRMIYNKIKKNNTSFIYIMHFSISNWMNFNANGNIWLINVLFCHGFGICLLKATLFAFNRQYLQLCHISEHIKFQHLHCHLINCRTCIGFLSEIGFFVVYHALENKFQLVCLIFNWTTSVLNFYNVSVSGSLFMLLNIDAYRRRATALTLTRLHFITIPDHPDLSLAPHSITRSKAAMFGPGAPTQAGSIKSS